MKSFILSLYCSGTIVIFLTAFACKGQTTTEQVGQVDVSSQTVLTTLREIKKLHLNLEHQLDQIDAFHNSAQHQCLTDIIVVLIEMYEQIVSATVTYYITINTSHHHNLHGSIARIVASGVVKIIGIVGRQIIYFVTHKELTWKEKICCCGVVAGILVMIKLGIDQIPKKDENLPTIYYVRPSIEQGQSSYLSNKFDDYK